MPQVEYQCPLCQQDGTIEYPTGFHPEVVFCLTCEGVFRYPLTIWQHLSDLNLDDAIGVFNLRPHDRPNYSPDTPLQDASKPEAPAGEWLAHLPLKYTLRGYQNRHSDDSSLTYYWRGTCRSLSAQEVKAYLDTQPHIPRKEDKPSRKQRSSRQGAEVPSTRQYTLTRDLLLEVARRQGLVQWRESGVVEQVRLEGSDIRVYRVSGPFANLVFEAAHVLPYRQVYYCREYIV